MRKPKLRVALPGRQQSAQSMVEFALALPIFLVLVMVTLQFSMLMVAQAGMIWVTTQTARYIATGAPERWQMADSCHTTYRNNQMAAFTVLRSANIIGGSYTITPAYQPGATNCVTVAGNSPATTRQR